MRQDIYKESEEKHKSPRTTDITMAEDGQMSKLRQEVLLRRNSECRAALGSFKWKYMMKETSGPKRVQQHNINALTSMTEICDRYMQQTSRAETEAKCTHAAPYSSPSKLQAPFSNWGAHQATSWQENDIVRPVGTTFKLIDSQFNWISCFNDLLWTFIFNDELLHTLAVL